jgi:hypothetical protein
LAQDRNSGISDDVTKPRPVGRGFVCRQFAARSNGGHSKRTEMTTDITNDRRIEKLRIVLLPTYVLILGITATAKFISAFGEQQVLSAFDFVIPLPIRYVLIGTAFCEAAVISIILFARHDYFKFLAVNFISALFLLYRLMRGVDTAHHCPCLGTVGAHLGLSPHASNVFLAVTSLVMFTSSLVFLILLLKPKNGLLLSPCPRAPATP